MNAANDNLKSAQKAYQSAQASLTDAQNSCSAPSLGLYGFNNISDALKNADSTKNQAESALDSAKNAVDTANTQISTCEQQVKAAHDSYDQEKNYSNLLNKSQNVEDSATKLEQAQRTPDNLETLRSTLEDCTPDCHDGRHHHGAECYRWFGLQRHRGYHPEYRCTGGGRDHSRQQRA